MIASVFSTAIVGIDAFIVQVEVDVSAGLPSFTIVGQPDTSVKEARERVKSAIKNSQFDFPPKRIVVNLSPADLRKEGVTYDLPIALGILCATGQVRGLDFLKKHTVCGELSLDGSVYLVKGVLSSALATRDAGFSGIIVPYENRAEGAVIESLDVFPVKTLFELVQFLNDSKPIPPYKVDTGSLFSNTLQCDEDFQDVVGQRVVKRGLEVAASGAHNVLMIGPPGSGKTMLARRLPGILPALTLDEAIEVTRTHSIKGFFPKGGGLLSTRPFRSPHHTISEVGLVGGGRTPYPGEVSLAHGGVLFLDEMPEFQRRALEALRQPMENGMITVARAGGTLDFPASFMLVGAMNPCPCGYFGDSHKECSCSPSSIQKYQARLSGPLLDRIDIHLEVYKPRFDEFEGRVVDGEPSSKIRQRVERARKIQVERFFEEGIHYNAQMRPVHIRKYCSLNGDGTELLKEVFERFGFSARARDSILKVSRTIADLDSSQDILVKHLSEAIQYRVLDREFWRVY